MSFRHPDELLSVLRSNLRRIEEGQCDEGLTPTEIEFKRLLRRLIDNVEAALKKLSELIQRNTETKPPSTDD